jgi:hypothetical protein
MESLANFLDGQTDGRIKHTGNLNKIKIAKNQYIACLSWREQLNWLKCYISFVCACISQIAKGLPIQSTLHGPAFCLNPATKASFFSNLCKACAPWADKRGGRFSYCSLKKKIYETCWTGFLHGHGRIFKINFPWKKLVIINFKKTSKASKERWGETRCRSYHFMYKLDVHECVFNSNSSGAKLVLGIEIEVTL